MGRAYSQDLRERVIAAVFAKPKAALRNAATRTFDALIEAIAQALADFTPRECARLRPALSRRLRSNQ
jgi:hypothetical protein